VAVTVLGLAGSARRGGNTETLLDWCLDAARDEGAVVVKFRLCDLDLHGCRACDACWGEGVCVVEDDMQLVYPHLRAVDSIVLAAPVYSMGIPAVPKMMIDRCQPYWALKYVLKRAVIEPGRRERLGAFLSCSGTTFLEVAPAGDLLCPGVDAKGEILDHPSARAVAEDIGRRLGRPR
jgi:multimeric flavodoxin WrbA